MRLFLLSMSGLASVASAQEVLYQLAPVETHFHDSVPLAGLTDVDGDGRRDFARGLATASAYGAVHVHSGVDGREIFRIAGDASAQSFGRALADAGDVDGDGVPDLLVGSTHKARVYSGRSAQLLHDFTSVDLSDRLGYAVAGVGDLDGDGRADIALGAPQQVVWGGCDNLHHSQNGPGYVRVHSGIDGSLLFRLDAPAGASAFGGAIVGLPDIDGDGRGEIAAASALEPAGLGAAVLCVFSGASGSLLFQDSLPGIMDTQLVSAGDLDADGFGDLLVGLGRHGIVEARSIVSGGTIFRITGPLFDRLGGSLAPAGDVDGDGSQDHWVGATQPNHACCFGFSCENGTGYAELLSGRDGHRLRILVGDHANGLFGDALVDLGDVDGDGAHDLLVAEPNHPTGHAYGRLVAFSGAEGTVEPYRYCASGQNSKWLHARLGWSGSTSVAANDLTFTIEDGVPDQVAVYFFGPDAQVRGFGQGFLCITAPFSRFAVRVLDSHGAARAPLDLTQSPGSVIAAGSTWKFQAWYQDALAGDEPYNTTDALSATFRP